MGAKLFEVICAGFLRAVVSAKVRRAAWRENCNLNMHLGPSRHLERKGYGIIQHDGMVWVEDFECGGCGAP
jgi:hypothetical protein